MHQDFVTGVGGTWPVPEGEVARQPAERIKKESTLEETKRLLQEGNTVAEIAKVRDMTTGTVWSHIEKLIEASEVGPEMSSILTRDVSNWPEIEQQFMTIIAKVGTEKLKPIYEAAGEQYDYEIIRLARVVYLLRS